MSREKDAHLFLGCDGLWSHDALEHEGDGEEGEQGPALCRSLPARRDDAAQSHAQSQQAYPQHFLDGGCLLLERVVDVLQHALHHS